MLVVLQTAEAGPWISRSHRRANCSWCKSWQEFSEWIWTPKQQDLWREGKWSEGMDFEGNHPTWDHRKNEKKMSLLLKQLSTLIYYINLESIKNHSSQDRKTSQDLARTGKRLHRGGGKHCGGPCPVALRRHQAGKKPMAPRRCHVVLQGLFWTEFGSREVFWSFFFFFLFLLHFLLMLVGSNGENWWREQEENM